MLFARVSRIAFALASTRRCAIAPCAQSCLVNAIALDGDVNASVKATREECDGANIAREKPKRTNDDDDDDDDAFFARARERARLRDGPPRVANSRRPWTSNFEKFDSNSIEVDRIRVDVDRIRLVRRAVDGNVATGEWATTSALVECRGKGSWCVA